jgi:hypothetical protein
MTTYQEVIRDLFEQKKRANPKLSLRGFARVLKISPTQLSLLMNGKRALSRKCAELIADRLQLNGADREPLLAVSVPRAGRVPSRLPKGEVLVDSSRLERIANVNHMAVLGLGSVGTNSACPEWIGGRLGIAPAKAQEAFEELEQLGLVERQGQGYRSAGRTLRASG